MIKTACLFTAITFTALQRLDANDIFLLRRNQNEPTDKIMLGQNEKKCDDPHKLMPLCERIIPGLEVNEKTGLYQFTTETANIRKILFAHAAKRKMPGTCQVYKYLSTSTLRRRQQHAGEVLDTIKPKNILDIGPYTNPIHTFMAHCPESVFMIEPCGELSHDGTTAWSSKEVSCSDGSKSVQNVIPQTIRTFLKSDYVEHFDAVVCIGCDYNFGPKWEQLMSLPRPFHLILEYPKLYGYPVGNTDKAYCTIEKTKDFDFSSCPDCGFDDAVLAESGMYAKDRKFMVLFCRDNASTK